jgi:crotonobetainyl-CoA:carnitine CoA-transferase CaiB-like acyl-CoA transferase
MTDTLLNGVRVLDLTDEKGFLCGNILGDLGADVIKIENPGGDASRNIPPYFKDSIDPQKSLYWFSYNANKRGITLNLEANKGQEIFKKLVKNADIVIESFMPGYLDKLGIGYNSLSKINIGLIMTSISPFGQTGPYSQYKGSDLVTQAMGVMLFQTGFPDRAPLRTTLPQAYMHAGVDAAEGTMIAHYSKTKTGIGQQVDVSMNDSVLGVAARAVSYWDCLGVEIPRTAGEYASPGGRFNAVTWETKDGFVSFVMHDGPHGAKGNRTLVDWIGEEIEIPQLIKKMDWENWRFLKAPESELKEYLSIIGKFFKKHTSIELEQEAAKRDLTLTKIYNTKDTVENIQLASRNFWVDLKHEELSADITYPGAFAIFSETPIKITRRAPLVGEHNKEIYLKELGMSNSEYDEMVKGGII